MQYNFEFWKKKDYRTKRKLKLSRIMENLYLNQILETLLHSSSNPDKTDNNNCVVSKNNLQFQMNYDSINEHAGKLSLKLGMLEKR